MEEGPWELDSVSFLGLIEAMNLFGKAFSCLSSLSSDPLFSSIVTLYILVLLYFPRIFLGIVFSPVLISTGVLLLTLLRLGVTQQVEGEPGSNEPELPDLPVRELKCVLPEPEKWPEIHSDFDAKPFFCDAFVGWNLRAPLEVIYEEFEGEEDEDEDLNVTEETRSVVIERYPSLSICYPESDSDTSSEGEFPAINGWDSPENMSFRWDQDDRDELIEIALDGKLGAMFHVEEDNLIEIDISPARNNQFSGCKR